MKIERSRIHFFSDVPMFLSLAFAAFHIQFPLLSLCSDFIPAVNVVFLASIWCSYHDTMPYLKTTRSKIKKL